MTIKDLRVYILFPISIGTNVLFLVAATIDFVEAFERETTGASFITYQMLSPSGTSLLFLSFLLFGFLLLLDTTFAFVSIYKGGKKVLGHFATLLVHHLGFMIWVIRLLTGTLVYSTGVSYSLLLLEFCFPLRMAIHYYHPEKESFKKCKRQLQVLFLDMFLSGGGSLAALLLYFIMLADTRLTGKMRSDILFTYLFCFVYWFVQLATAHRASLNRLLAKAVAITMEQEVNNENYDSNIGAVVEKEEVDETCNTNHTISTEIFDNTQHMKTETTSKGLEEIKLDV